MALNEVFATIAHKSIMIYTIYNKKMRDNINGGYVVLTNDILL